MDYSQQVAELSTIIASATAAKARYERGITPAPQDEIDLLISVGNLFNGFALDVETARVVRDICIESDLDQDTYERIPHDGLTGDYDDDRESWLERRSTFGMVPA